MRGVTRILGILAIASLIAAPAGAQIQVPQRLPHTAPGGNFVLTGINLTSQGLSLTLNRDGTAKTLDPAKIEGWTTATFTVPKDVAPGDYFVMVKQGEGQPVYTATLVVTAPPETATTPKILRTIPTAGVLKLWWLGSQYDFDIIGERLTVTPPASAITLRLDDQPIELKVCTPLTAGDTLNEKTQSEPCYAIPAGEAGRTVSIHGLSTWKYGGPHKVSLVTPAGPSTSEKPVMVRISRITPRMIKWLSLAFVAILVGLLTWLGRDAFVAAAGSARQRFLAWVLLDQQTNSFSLSKVQFLMWLFTIAYAYVLLQLTFVFVDGKTAMAPFPNDLSMMLGLSGGTSLTSIMLTRSRGSKGAGDSGPALSDLVSTGGILAPDRAQLVLWTVIACCSYLLIVLRTPIESFTALPSVDAGMLGAMGVSAVVYAGGKSVRLPGPVINQVAKTSANDLTIKGQNLHKNAIISLDRQPAEATIVATPTPGASDALSAELEVTITPIPFATGDHLLRVTNLDGQYAEAWFAADPPKLDQVKVGAAPADEVPAGATEASLTLTGTGFRVGSSAEWLTAGQTSATVIAAEKVTIASDTNATVALTPGAAKGSATITLVSPHGIRAARVVNVK